MSLGWRAKLCVIPKGNGSVDKIDYLLRGAKYLVNIKMLWAATKTWQPQSIQEV